VERQEGHVQLGDDEVLVIARIAEERTAVAAAGQVSDALWRGDP
jgi:hypothetical protein